MEVEFPESALKRIVIVGSGFGGMELAKKLDSEKFQVVLLDKNNYHTFQPLLYQVATGGLEPDSIAYPIRKIFSHKKNFHFRIAVARKVSPEKNILFTDIGEVHYDYLVIAMGSSSNFFGNMELQQHALPLKTITDALDMRSFLLQNCEKAILATNNEEQRRLLNVVVIGGGPTGVEIAGAMTELKRHVLPNDYPGLDFNLMQIQIIEGGDKLLPTMSRSSQLNSKKVLERMGVKIWLNTLLKNYDGEKVTLSDGQVIESKIVIWTAGVKGMTIEGLSPDSMTKGNRISVNEFNQAKGFEYIFAIGDVAAMHHETSDAYPMVAPVAIQQAKALARNLNSGGKEWKPFRYSDKGSMATIGRNQAVADLKALKLHGFIAWMAWLFIHLIMLIGFRNRIIVLINWIWNYVSYDRAIRLIIRPVKKK